MQTCNCCPFNKGVAYTISIQPFLLVNIGYKQCLVSCVCNNFSFSQPLFQYNSCFIIEVYYLIASCAVGLFDASLNFMWNETIINLREKIIRFDINYFFDSTLGANERSKFKSEKDLEKIEDWKLIRGCKETGIISDIGYKHLDYIRDMRNFASAAHPNQIQLTGLQLVSWLETCIIEVLGKEPSGPVLEVK